MAGIWMRVFPPEDQRRTHFTENPGLVNVPQRNSPPIRYFMLLFTVDLMREIIRQTNRYAQNFLKTFGHGLGSHSRAKTWKRLTMKEFQAFLAVFYNMGIIKKASIPQYWNSRYPNDYKRNHPAYDPASRFSPLLNYMNRQFLRYIIPNRNLCVDETLISCKGHSVMRQYIPSKAAKYGIRFWVLCEAATGYILQMHIYRGKHFDPTPNGQLQGTNVVYDLLRNTNLLNKGYHVICDSFFSSLHLANKLLEARTYVTGTLRKNRPMPQTIKNANPAPGSAIYMRKGQVVCLAYRGEEDKTPVRLLSTLLPAQELPTHRPRIIQQYINTWVQLISTMLF
ncbi:hypothetical protein KUTeg_011225 [Tegillarca granosa]|uniref:PiggyBac transposable element-derived protein domain-containing protein n=1 Tax=Tegillarca granosa TaxID=220873 RepID=A0ABQ9F4L0_TEGGR|nr:hypothetical protein KUTeg_011225 [Tegillarca granosa]